MGIKVTHEDFVKNVYNKVGKEYTVLGRYVKAKTKLDIRHNLCGNIWSISPDNFLRGRRCPTCRNTDKYEKTRHTIDKFKERVYKLVGEEYTVVSNKYTNARSNVDIKHNICGHTWSVKPYHFAKDDGTRCPHCSQVEAEAKRRKDKEAFCREVDLLTDGEYKVVGDYVNAITKIDIIHNICGNIYNVEPNSFLNGNRCSLCKSSISKGEIFITNFLKSNDIKFIYQYSFDNCKNKHKLPFDFAILNDREDVVMLIEYDGRQHFEAIEFWGGEEEFERIKLCDKIKDNYCIDNNIKLIRIPYWDYENLGKILDDLF